MLIPRLQGTPNLKFSLQYIDENQEKLPKVERNNRKPIFLDCNKKPINSNTLVEKNRYFNKRNLDTSHRYPMAF
jgi:hypothetical protein